MKLVADSLIFSYGKGNVLNGVSFEGERGDFICILGENGAGKSTILKCLCRVLKPSQGKVSIDGKDIREFSAKKLAQKVSFVPQNYNPVYACSVLDFLYMGRNPYKNVFESITDADKAIVSQIIDEFDFNFYIDKQMNELSGGERKRILLMRALVQDTDIIVLDEPTNQLDFHSRIQFMELLARLARDGKTIIMTTHLPEDALNYANKTIIVSNGSTKQYSNEEVSVDILKKLYGITIEIIEGNNVKRKACVAELTCKSGD